MRLIFALLFVAMAGQISAATCAEFWADSTLPIDENLACLSWAVPTQNADGSPISDLAGYRIYYGEDSAAISIDNGDSNADGVLRRADSSVTMVEITNAQADAYEMLIQITEPTTIYFGIAAIDNSNPANESVISEIVDKVIRFVDNQAPGQVQTFRVQMRIRVPVDGGELHHP